jgi:hypothetical protein
MVLWLFHKHTAFGASCQHRLARHVYGVDCFMFNLTCSGGKHIAQVWTEGDGTFLGAGMAWLLSPLTPGKRSRRQEAVDLCQMVSTHLGGHNLSGYTVYGLADGVLVVAS